jgi:LPXTG-motif cell wall-anchored protein
MFWLLVVAFAGLGTGYVMVRRRRKAGTKAA